MEVNIFSKIAGMLRAYHKGLFNLSSFSILGFIGVLTLRLVSFTINTMYFALKGVLFFFFNRKKTFFDKLCYIVSDLLMFALFPYLYIFWLFLRFCFYLFYLFVSYCFILYFSVWELIFRGFDKKPRELLYYRNLYYQFDDWYFARKKLFFQNSLQFYFFWIYLIVGVGIYDRILFPFVILPFLELTANIIILILILLDELRSLLLDGILALEEYFSNRRPRHLTPRLRLFYIIMYFKLIFRRIFTTVWYIISDFFFFGYQNLQILWLLFLFFTQSLRYNLRLLFLYIRLYYVLLFRVSFYEYILKFVFYRILYVLQWVRYFIFSLFGPELSGIVWGLNVLWNCIIFIYCLLPTPIADFIYGGALFAWIYVRTLYLHTKLFFASITFQINCLKHIVRLWLLYWILFFIKLKKAFLFLCFCLHVSCLHPGVVYGLLKWEFYICYIIIKDELTYKFRSLRMRMGR